MSVHILERDGEAAFVILPIEEYRRLLALVEDARDAAAIEEFYRRLVAGEEEMLPSHVVDRMLDGENPVLVLRDYRRMTLQQLADLCGVTNSHVSQVEKGKRSMSTEVLKKMAEALRVDVELLL
jgi:DNA-binding XRE family transcriptional regulator